MKRVRTNQPTAPSRRTGFTLLELLIAIGIIALLASFIVVAVQGAQRAAVQAAVKTEMNEIDTALGRYKEVYGVYPPSAIVLCENPGEWANTMPASGDPSFEARQASLAELQRSWPFFNPATLDLDGSGSVDASDGIDFNGDGDIADIIQLDGAECLAFFLGGMMNTDVVQANASAGTAAEIANGSLVSGKTAGDAPTTWGPLGFGKSPTNPFTRAVASRIGPFIELDTSRLDDRRDNDIDASPLPSLTVAPTSATSDGMPSYFDPISDQLTPYAYFRSVPIGGYSYSGVSVASVSPIDNDASSLRAVYSNKAGQVLNGKTYQLVSPGFDGEFGVGGVYEDDDGVGNDPNRRAEADNMANFASGVLGR